MTSSLFLLKSFSSNLIDVKEGIVNIGCHMFTKEQLLKELSTLERTLRNPIKNSISELGKETGEMITGTIVNTFKELGITVMGAIVKGAYPICLFAGVLGLIMYMCGWEKAKPAPVLAIGAFLIIKALGGIICGI